MRLLQGRSAGYISLWDSTHPRHRDDRETTHAAIFRIDCITNCYHQPSTSTYRCDDDVFIAAFSEDKIGRCITHHQQIGHNGSYCPAMGEDGSPSRGGDGETSDRGGESATSGTQRSWTHDITAYLIVLMLITTFGPFQFGYHLVSYQAMF